MLYNVIFGNEKFAPDPWQTIEENGYTFYEKADIHQRIRLDPALEEKVPIKEVYKANSVQAYDFGGGVRFRPNGNNMNGVLRPLVSRPNVDQTQQYLVYVTVMNNYHLIDFNTDYQILGTYHEVGKWQGAILSFSYKDIMTINNPTLLTFWCYNRKKDVANMCTVSFTTKEEDGQKVIDTEHVVTKVTGIKDAEEKARVIRLYNEHANKYMGFKCVTGVMQFVTSTYIVGPEYHMTAEDLIPIKRTNMIFVSEGVLNDHDQLASVIHEGLEGKRIRAITLLGCDIPLDIIKENGLLYVFKWNENVKKLDCIKSN